MYLNLCHLHFYIFIAWIVGFEKAASIFVSGFVNLIFKPVTTRSKQITRKQMFGSIQHVDVTAYGCKDKRHDSRCGRLKLEV